jgi:hypothetical protein
MSTDGATVVVWRETAGTRGFIPKWGSTGGVPSCERSLPLCRCSPLVGNTTQKQSLCSWRTCLLATYTPPYIFTLTAGPSWLRLAAWHSARAVFCLLASDVLTISKRPPRPPSPIAVRPCARLAMGARPTPSPRTCCCRGVSSSCPGRM